MERTKGNERKEITGSIKCDKDEADSSHGPESVYIPIVTEYTGSQKTCGKNCDESHPPFDPCSIQNLANINLGITLHPITYPKTENSTNLNDCHRYSQRENNGNTFEQGIFL
jgi:hypothetical protein